MRRVLIAAVAVVGMGCHQPRNGPPVPALSAIDRLIDSARVAGLPTDPLRDRVARGRLSGATDDQILESVRRLVRGEAQILRLESLIARSRVTPHQDSVMKELSAQLKAGSVKRAKPDTTGITGSRH